MPALREPTDVMISLFYINMNGSLRRLKPASFSQKAKILMFTTMGLGGGTERTGILVAVPAVLMEGPHSDSLELAVSSALQGTFPEYSTARARLTPCGLSKHMSV